MKGFHVKRSPVYDYSPKWNRFPFNPAKLPFFYGWLVMLAGAGGIIMSSPGQTIGVGVFRNYLEADLNLSKLNLSIAYTVGTLISGFLASRAGKLYDKLGARIMAPVAGFGMGLALIYLAKSVQIIAALPIQEQGLVSNIVKIAVLVVGFFAIRFFGQGVLTMVSRNMVMQWFDTRRGFANMFIGAFVAGGFSVAPKVFQDLIDRSSWQQAWIMTGIFAIVVFGVFSLIFFRDKPENYGLKPDGNFRSTNPKVIKLLPKKSYTKDEAVKTPQYWIYNFTLTMHAFFVTGFTFYVKDIFAAAGMDTEKALSIFVPAAAVAITVQIIGSLLSDFVKIKYIGLVLLLGLIVNMSGTFMLKHSWAFYVLVFGNGLSSGMFGILSSIVWPRNFGVKHLGAISGHAMGYIVIGSAIGPVFFALFNRVSGSFQSAVIVSLVITVVLGVFAVKTKNLNTDL